MIVQGDRHVEWLVEWLWRWSDLKNDTMRFTSDNTDVVSVDSRGNVKARKAGTVTIRVEVTAGGVTRSDELMVHVDDPLERLVVKAKRIAWYDEPHKYQYDKFVQRMYQAYELPNRTLKAGSRDQARLDVAAFTAAGMRIIGGRYQTAFKSLTPDVATVDASGMVTPKVPGKAQVEVTVTFRGKTKCATVDIEVVK